MIMKFSGARPPAARSRRSYRQYCAVAAALDAVGDRWTLLVARQLVMGPRRFGDLLGDLPGIGPNLLSRRLRRLESVGLVRRESLPRPARSAVYALTDAGRALEPVVLTLGRFGLSLLGPPRKGLLFRPEWALLAMRIRFRTEAARGLRETWEYRLDGRVFHVRVHDGRAQFFEGAAADPALVIETDTPTFLALGAGRLSARAARKAGALRVEGSARSLARSLSVFGVPLTESASPPPEARSRR
jgi:DNA-binding HxlR family transcriptional regulator